MGRKSFSTIVCVYGKHVLFGLLLLGTLESHNERYVKLEFLGSFDDSFCDIITSHDTTKDVDEDTFHFRVGEKNLERFLDGFSGCTSM